MPELRCKCWSTPIEQILSGVPLIKSKTSPIWKQGSSSVIQRKECLVSSIVHRSLDRVTNYDVVTWEKAIH